MRSEGKAHGIHEFHQLAASETSDALRKTAKNYLGRENLSENQINKITQAGGDECEARVRKMSERAFQVVNLPPRTPIQRTIEF